MTNKPQVTVPMWISRYNFMSLLNLPDIVKEFGSPRIYFEGKFLGERYLQDVKTTRLRCPPRNVNQILLKKLHEGKALESMMATQSSNIKTFKDTEPACQMNKRKHLNGNVKIYYNMDAVVLNAHSNIPLSIVITAAGEYGILYYHNGCNRGQINLLKINHSNSITSVHDGLNYWTWTLTKDILDFDDWEAADFAVLLPKFASNTPMEYTIVTKEWSPVMLANYEYARIGIESNKVGTLETACI